jgi:hypothetical protein
MNRFLWPWLFAILIAGSYEYFSGQYVPPNAIYLSGILIPWFIALFVLCKCYHRKVSNEWEVTWSSAILSFPFLLYFFERTIFLCHRLPIQYADLVAIVLKILGKSVVTYVDPLSMNACAAVADQAGWKSISIALEKTSPGIVVGLVLMALLFTANIKSWERRFIFFFSCTGVIIVWSAVKVAGSILLYVGTKWIASFWNPICEIALFIPISILLALLTKVTVTGQGAKAFPVLPQKFLKANVLTLFTFFIFILLNYYIPLGSRVNGKVLLDDFHSNWEWSKVDFGRDSYGERATYSANAYRQLLQKYWTVDVNSNVSLDAIPLSDYKVIILKTPTKPYSNKEKSALLSYARSGGSLYLLGDHTNLFGMSTYLNVIAKESGLEFEFNDQFDLTTQDTTKPEYSFLWNHPISSHLARLTFLTSCTLKCPLGSDIITGRGMGVEPVDYSHVHFFGNIKVDPDENWGAFVQMASVFYGKGQVMAFADSTCISTFCIYDDCKPSLAIAAVDFLNRNYVHGEVWQWMRSRSWWLVALIGFVFLLAPIRPGILVPVSAFVAILFVLGLSNINYTQFPLPIRFANKAICFDSSLSGARIARMLDNSNEAINDDHVYDMWFLNFLRLGYEPYYDNPLRLDGFPKLRVIIHPQSAALTESRKQKLLHDIKSGQKYIILCELSSVSEREMIEKILTACNVSFYFKDVLIDKASESSWSIVINGDSECLTVNAENGEKFEIIRVKIGDGELTLLNGCEIFNRKSLGPIYNATTKRQRSLCEVEYAIIRYCFHDGSLSTIKERALEVVAD